MNKKLPLWLFLLLTWMSAIVIICFGFCVWHIDQGGKIFGKKGTEIILFTARLPNLIKQTYKEIMGVYPNILHDDRFNNISFFKFEKGFPEIENYLLLSVYDPTYHQSVVKLISVKSQKTIHLWIPDIHEIYGQVCSAKPSISSEKYWKKAFKINHPLLEADGSIVFHIGDITSEFGSALFKIDAESKLKWVLKGSFHHSLEFDSEGNIWLPSYSEETKSKLILPGDYLDDGVAEISSSGKVLFKKSIYELLIKQGYKGLVWGVGEFENDPLHITDIQPALTTSAYWKKNDLLISLRHRSTVLLYRPSADSIVWLKTGPWLNQHDVDFIDSTKIGVFGNDVIRLKNNLSGYLTNGYNEEYIFDFSNGETKTPYTAFLRKANVKTPTQGRSDILDNGDLFIEETDNGRILLGNKKNIIWQYVERINPNSVGAVVWSRILTEKEFKKLTFLSQNPN